MFNNILEVLTCPKCGKKLEINNKKEENGEIIEGILICNSNHSWVIREGIIDFESEEQEFANNWSRVYKHTDYEKLEKKAKRHEKKVKRRTPKSQKEAQEIVKTELIKYINQSKARTVLDIATGRGMLLTTLADNISSDINLVCVDLSFDILKYDRFKVMKINPAIKVNYIACDATKLPFFDNSFDLSVSFFGIGNMDDPVEGIKEGVRVSKGGLMDAWTVIRDDNPKIAKINKIITRHGFNYNVENCTETNSYNLHKIDDSYNVEVSNLYSGIAERNKNDLIPIKGEWYGMNIIKVNNG